MCRRLVTLLAFLLLAALPGVASAQVSIWLQKGVSGFGGSAGVGGNNGGVGLFADAGYSYKGFLDFDLGLGGFAPKDFLGADDAVVYSLAPTVQYHPLKQSQDFPFSLGLGAAFVLRFVNSPMLKDQGIDSTGWDAVLNASVYRFFRFSENTGMIPSVGIQFTHAELTAKDDFGQSLTAKTDNIDGNIAVYLAYLSESGRIYGLVPQLSFGDSATTFTIAFNIIFSIL